MNLELHRKIHEHNWTRCSSSWGVSVPGGSYQESLPKGPGAVFLSSPQKPLKHYWPQMHIPRLLLRPVKLSWGEAKNLHFDWVLRQCQCICFALGEFFSSPQDLPAFVINPHVLNDKLQHSSPFSCRNFHRLRSAQAGEEQTKLQHCPLGRSLQVRTLWLKEDKRSFLSGFIWTPQKTWHRPPQCAWHQVFIRKP